MFKRLKKAAAVICAAAMVLSMTACGSAGDKKVVLHFTHTQSPGSISDLTAQEFKKLVEERSDGRIEVSIYSNCGLSGGDLTKAIELVQAGNIDIHSCAPPNIANYDKKFYSFWLPFLFPNSDDLLAFCHSDKVHEVVNGWCNDLEMEMLGINNAGSRQISNSKKEITKPEDLKGMNIRVPGANIFIDLYRNYFGANPTAMDFSEVYTSLQQKTIDGQENPIAVFDSSKFAEVQQYVTLWDGVRDTTIWVMSRKTMNKLSPEDQELVKECAAEALDLSLIHIYYEFYAGGITGKYFNRGYLIRYFEELDKCRQMYEGRLIIRSAMEFGQLHLDPEKASGIDVYKRQI